MNFKNVVVGCFLMTNFVLADQCNRYFLDQITDREVHNQLIHMNARLNSGETSKVYTLITPEGRRVHVLEAKPIDNAKDIESIESALQLLNDVGVRRLGEVDTRNADELFRGDAQMREAHIQGQKDARTTPFVEVVPLRKQKMIDAQIQKRIENKTRRYFYTRAFFTTVFLAQAYFYDSHLTHFFLFFATLESLPLIMHKTSYPSIKANVTRQFAGHHSIEAKKEAEKFLADFEESYGQFLRDFDDKHIIIISTVPLRLYNMRDFLIERLGFKPATFDVGTFEYTPL